MQLLDDIRKPVAAEMASYEEYVKSSLLGTHKLTESMVSYVMQTRGKAVRPLLVLLSARALLHDGELPRQTHLAAMLVEMMHTASLIHDDVIDNADIRRGKASVKAQWNSHRAVLIGDFILAKTYSTGMESGCFDIVSYVSRSMIDLCEGELLQSDKSERMEMSLSDYEEIIYLKTASLIGTCSAVGALSVSASGPEIAAMRRFGDMLGMAFQIKDDILDFTGGEKTGKPVYGDLLDRKITLPLLSVLESCGEGEKKHIMELMSGIQDNPENVADIAGIIQRHGGCAMAAGVMADYIEKAKNELNAFTPSPAREALFMLCDFVAERES